MFVDIIKSDIFIGSMAGIIILLFILYIAVNIKLAKLNKKYKTFMKKLGNGNDIEEILRKYVEKVDKIELRNEEIIKYCTKLDETITTCIQKIGMVRYSAFKDTGSDLSFALALLDDNDNGVILNGIYSREMSNIYAKQVLKGEASNKLSDEEKQALEIAVGQGKGYKIKE